MFGSKADNLKKLKEAGLNVPDFCVISNEEFLNSSYLNKINNLENGKYAVRSSCNLEDGDDDSFAGLFNTYLNVDKDNIDSKIKECMNNINNENVINYSRKNSIDISKLKMNVIIQKMVDSELSGVLFTSNPLGILNESIIVVSEGLGENVVADKGITTSYYFNNDDKIYYYEGKNIVSNDLVLKLIGESVKIKKIFGDYLDIEFAIKNNIIYILQCRKITTINDENPIILDNSNIVESYPNVSSPLTISFVNEIYSLIFTRLINRILKNKNDLIKLNIILNDMTDSYNGRMYYKINNWYALLKYLPFSNKIISIWQDMMGVKVKDSLSNDVKISKLSKIKACKNYFSELLKSQNKMKALNQDFLSIEAYYKNTYNENLNLEELIGLYSELKNKILNNWDITLINDMYTFLYTGLLKSHLKKKCPRKYEKLTNDYISGISNIESMKPIKELINLAYCEKNYTKDEFVKLKNDYINKYGDRSLEELKLESKTFRTNAELLDQKIKEYQTDATKLEELHRNINKEYKVKDKKDVITAKLINKIYSGISNREVSRLNRSRIFGMVREIFLTIGKKFTSEDIIAKIDDIFYLTKEEIFNYDKDINYKEIIDKRKKEYNMYRKLPAYSRVVFQDKVFNKVVTNDVDKNINFIDNDILKGVPASFGATEGEALVIEDINKNIETKNKILITKMTDPGWVFLMANSKGIISEKGSLLSHTAIVSRELKIPSIVGVPHLLETIHSGDYIKMNANNGEIEIIKRGKQ